MIWRFPKSWGYPKKASILSNFHEFSTINHPVYGDPPWLRKPRNGSSSDHPGPPNARVAWCDRGRRAAASLPAQTSPGAGRNPTDRLQSCAMPYYTMIYIYIYIYIWYMIYDIWYMIDNIWYMISCHMLHGAGICTDSVILCHFGG